MCTMRPQCRWGGDLGENKAPGTDCEVSLLPHRYCRTTGIHSSRICGLTSGSLYKLRLRPKSEGPHRQRTQDK